MFSFFNFNKRGFSRSDIKETHFMRGLIHHGKYEGLIKHIAGLPNMGNGDIRIVRRVFLITSLCKLDMQIRVSTEVRKLFLEDLKDTPAIDAEYIKFFVKVVVDGNNPKNKKYIDDDMEEKIATSYSKSGVSWHFKEVFILP